MKVDPLAGNNTRSLGLPSHSLGTALGMTICY